MKTNYMQSPMIYELRVTAGEFAELVDAESDCYKMNEALKPIFDDMKYAQVVRRIIGEDAYRAIPWGMTRPRIVVIDNAVSAEERVVVCAELPNAAAG